MGAWPKNIGGGGNYIKLIGGGVSTSSSIVDEIYDAIEEDGLSFAIGFSINFEGSTLATGFNST
jgi:uncharacterized protein YcsI (UPF0317 family)